MKTSLESTMHAHLMQSDVFKYWEGSTDVRGLLSGCKKQGGWSVALPGCQHASQTNARGGNDAKKQAKTMES